MTNINYLVEGALGQLISSKAEQFSNGQGKTSIDPAAFQQKAAVVKNNVMKKMSGSPSMSK